MKKLFLFVSMFLLASTFGYAQEWVGVNKSTPVRIQETLVSSSEEEIVIDVKVAGFYQEAVKTPNGSQLIISGEDMASMLIKGAPDLPMYPISMIIGDRAEMEVSVVKSNYVDLENVEVAPSKGNFSRQINPADVEYVYGEMYQQDAFYPATQASLEAPYILRDFRGQNLMVYPYAYNPATKTLRVYTELRLAVKKVSDNGENQKVTRRSNKISLDNETKASYERRFINFGNQSKYDFLVDEGEMLIICIDEYMEAVQPLVEWKNISGRPTTMVGVSETGTDEAMKTYVQNYYNQNPNFRYLLLVGEYNNLPPHTMTWEVKSDNYYGMLEGNDYYEEVFVGRLSVNSLADAQHQVGKIIHYERDIDETATWLSRAVGVAANEGTGHNGEADYVHMNYIRDTLMNYTITEMSQHYAYVNNPTAANMIADFNIGASVTNYCNHGSPDGWAVANFSNTHVHQLTNDNKLSYIWSVACNNGQFDYQECFAEAWMRAKNNSTDEPTGAIGGMFSWISQPWVPPMYGQDEMVAILTEWRPGYKHTLGGASMNGNMFVLDMSPEDAGDTHNSWLLFGDPSMMVRTEAPESMGVTTQPSTLVIGMSSLVVNADTDFGIATLSKDGEVLASAYVENGVAELEFPAISNVGNLQLVVIGYNKVTEVIDIEAIPADGAFLIYDSHDFNQADGQMDYNDNISLSLDIKNVGNDPTSNVTVELSTESEYITITDATASIASIAGNATATLANEFAFKVAPNVPDQAKIEFIVTSSDGTDTWVTSFKVTANAPILNINDVEVDGDVQAGGTATISLTFINEGNSAAYDIVTELMSSSPDITVTTTKIETEEVAAGETYTVSSEFAIASTVENGSVYEIIYSTFADFAIFTSKEIITIGNIIESFETGDFSAYDWEFGGSANWTIESTGAYDGTYCVKSGDITDSQQSVLKVQLEVLADGEISFYTKVSSESNYDKLFFFIDNAEKGNWSGEEGWTMSSFPITKGTHTIEWRYSKDYSYDEGEDCAWVDMISFPPVNIVEALNPVENLTAEVNASTVTLSWDALSGADEYIVRREGEEVATQTETTFTETLAEEGVYVYSVIARNGNKYSTPAFVVANISTVGVGEIENNNVDVYPNPTTGILYVELDVNFDATVYNYQGQVVMRTSDNNGQIDMSGLTSGVYFVQINTGKNIMIEKVIIK